MQKTAINILNWSSTFQSCHQDKPSQISFTNIHVSLFKFENEMFSCDTDLLSNGTISNLVLAGGVSKLPGYYEDTKNRIGISGIPLKVIQRAPRKSLLRKFGNRI